MSILTLTPFTGKVGGSSVGGSPPGSTRPSIPVPLPRARPEPTVGKGRFSRRIPLTRSGEPNLQLEIRTPEREADLSESESLRLQCYLLLHQLDAGGLEEALKSLRAMVEFYAVPRAPIPEPEVRRLPARYTGSYTEPVYPIAED